jgi:hypothetical protein
VPNRLDDEHGGLGRCLRSKPGLDHERTQQGASRPRDDNNADDRYL